MKPFDSVHRIKKSRMFGHEFYLDYAHSQGVWLFLTRKT